MCELCRQNNGEMVSCQDCGKLICFHIKSTDDVIAPAYVTASGDLFCRLCGERVDAEEERIYEKQAAFYPAGPYDEVYEKPDPIPDE